MFSITINDTTYEKFNYVLEAVYPEGVINIQQNTFQGYKKSEVQNTIVNNDTTDNTVNNTPSDWDPVDTSSENTTVTDNNIVTDSGSGWDDDYEEETVVKNPRLSKKTKVIRKRKTFILRLRNTTSNAKWKISNKKVGKIVYKTGESIKIKGIKKGRTYITAYVDGKILKCKVTVK